MAKTGKKILITGGRGFIGSNLRTELLRRGHEVWVCDLLNAEGDTYLRCDVSKYQQVERVFEAHHFDYVYHAAAEYGRWNGEDYYENLWATNVVGTKNLLRLQEKKRFKMIFFSSAEVYGDYDGVMNEEVMDTVAIKQMNDYALSKWVGELQVLNSAEMFHTETVRIRPFNVYGPGEHYTPYRGFVPKFMYLALQKKPYTVFLGHRRTLEYIDDFCRALATIVDNFKPGTVYNLGGDENYEIKFISDLILRSLGKDDAQVTYKDAEPFTTKIKTPDSTKAKTDLGFHQAVSIEDGIRRTAQWFKNLYPQ